MTDQLRYELIENFLDGKLSLEEQERVQNLISTDKTFAGDVENFKLCREIVVDASLLEEKLLMQQVDFKKLNTRIKLKRSLPYLISFSAILLITIGIVNWPKSKQNTVVDQKTSTNDQNVKLVDTLQSKTNKSVEPTLKLTKPNTPSNIMDTSSVAQKSSKVIPDTLTKQIAIDSVVTLTKQLEDTLQQKDLTSPCQNIIFTGSLITESSCTNDASGSIRLDKFSGGTKPYSFELSPGPTSSFARFTNLESGIYSISVVDAIGCDTTFENIEVKEQFCPEYSYILYKSDPDEFQFDFYKVGSGSVTLLNKSGQIVSTLTFSKNVPMKWNGKGANGIDLATGLYPFIVKYGNGIVKKGEVTIAE